MFLKKIESIPLIIFSSACGGGKGFVSVEDAKEFRSPFVDNESCVIFF